MAKKIAVFSAKSDAMMAKKPDFLENYELAEPVLKKLFGSKLRIGILNELAAKPMTLADLSRGVRASAPNVSAKLKELASGGFIEREDGCYKLTGWGRYIHSDASKSIRNLSVFEKFKDFWTSRKTDSVPEELWDKLWMLENCNLIKTDERNEAAVEESGLSLMQGTDKFLYGISPFFHKPLFELLLNVCVSKDIEFKGMATRAVLEETVKLFRGEFRDFASRENVKIYESDLKDIDMVVTERYMSLGFESKKSPNVYMDMDLEGTDRNAIEWGKNFFERLLKSAKPAKLEDYL